eukprot:TRINITY_DN1067_c0_g1_i2.p1 TRINITY_DN1067_c0_g1~~TRINITY_DN1067_c0_g1_i2.p1  ORF type:complete len:292 (-),score=69.07 TRINITY_DN1067_c0_g1_i2:191-1066(-)
MAAAKLEEAQFQSFIDRFDAFLFDCDGVLWLGDKLISNVDAVLSQLRLQGKKVFFVTNNATKGRESYVEKLTSLGIQASKDEVFGSAFATSYYLKSHGFAGKVYIVGEAGICHEFEEAGIRWCGGPEDSNKTAQDVANFVPDPEVTAVVVGLDRHINYYKLCAAFCYIRTQKCAFIATNRDLTFPADGRMLIGGGSIVQSVAASSGVEPVTTGKPEKWMLEALIEEHKLDRSKMVMVGDRLDTDIAFGDRGGVTTLLVLTGVTTEDILTKSELKPDYVLPSLGDLSKAFSQ